MFRLFLYSYLGGVSSYPRDDHSPAIPPGSSSSFLEDLALRLRLRIS